MQMFLAPKPKIKVTTNKALRDKINQTVYP